MKKRAFVVLACALVGACARPYRFDIEAGAGDGLDVDADAVAQDVLIDPRVADTIDAYVDSALDASSETSVDSSPDSSDAGGPAPTLLAPLSTATVTSHAPTFHWQLSGGIAGAHVEICSDRPCAHVEQAFDAIGASGAAPTHLIAGVHFWHARASTGTTYSPTWEFWVGARSANVDTSWGTTLDVNGDGIPDAVVGAGGALSNTGRAYVYLGGPTGLATTAATVLTGPDGANGEFGFSVSSAGDVNGDGFADLIIGTLNAGNAYLYLGSPSGLVVGSATMLTVSNVGGFGQSVASAGDVNGDGYADVAVGAPGTAVYVFLGSSAGLQTTPATRLAGPANANFGHSFASAGDVNGDGFADVIVGAYGSANAFIFLGSASGLNTLAATTLSGPPGNNYGWEVACAGDVNGDGYADEVVGSDGLGTAYIYVGSATGVATTAATTLSVASNSSFGSAVAGAGDVNGDGFSDVLIGNAGGAVGAYVFAGSIVGVSTSPLASLNVSGATGFGVSVAGLGDATGDGYADVIIGADATTRAFVFAGSSSGTAMSPITTLFGPDGGAFGLSVASRKAWSVKRALASYGAQSAPEPCFALL